MRVPAGQLPVTPRVTAGLGIIGVVLIASGAAYAFYSIRRPKLACLFSTAFLTATAYACMAVFLYEPPATQGGQAGLAIGGILVSGLAGVGGMKALTGWGKHAMCYMLAGFCLCMWLLTIKTGGLFGPGTKDDSLSTNPYNAVGYALSLIISALFSFCPFVRPYLDIGCVGFSASTMAVLGADCFTRAGYKEFWIWVWGVNTHWFPDQDLFTYPVTRPIQAEQGSIAALTLFSIVWQLELWKPKHERQYVQVKEQMRREAAEQKAREERDLEAGRQVLEVFGQEQRIFKFPRAIRHKFWDAYMRRPDSRQRVLDLEEETNATGDNKNERGDSPVTPPNDGDQLSVSHISPSVAATKHRRGLSREQGEDAVVENEADEVVGAVEQPEEQLDEPKANARPASASQRLSSWRTKEWTQRLNEASRLAPEPLYSRQNADPDEPAPLDIVDLLRTSNTGGVMFTRQPQAHTSEQARLIGLENPKVDPWSSSQRRGSTSAMIQANKRI